MLRRRGIALEVCLILVASYQVRCQGYDYAEDGEGNSEYSEDGEEHGHPDYSKYYSVEGSAPAAVQAGPGGNAETTGFINPAEFTSFFSSPIVIGASNKKEVTNPQTFFAPAPEKADPLSAIKNQFPQYYTAPSNADPITRDYFEESQRVRALENQEEDALKPGPYYISHSLPIKSFYEDGDKAASKDDVETISPKPNKKSNGYDDEAQEATDEEEIHKFRTIGEETLPLKNDKQFVDYNVGKSSSTVSQYPYASGLASTTLSPYQKYSFRPVSTNISPKYLEDLVSTIAPFNPSLPKVSNEANQETQSSENTPEKLKGCKKLLKPATDNHDAMNCFVCEDLTNKSKYTQCSYSAEPSTPVHYYTGSSERYSVPAKSPESFRYKRHARRSDPYELIKQRSRQYYDEFEKDHDAEETERQKDYKYVPYSYDDGDESYSESQSEEFKKNPELCKKVEKDGMTCTICKNEKTGGNFEQCSYTVAPKEQKYAYVAEKKYDSDDPQGENNGEAGETRETPQNVDSSEKAESKEAESSEETTNDKEVGAESREGDKYPSYHYDANKPDKHEPTSKLVDNVHYDVPSHFAESIKNEKNAEDESDEKDDYNSYHYKIFPHLTKEESKQQEAKYPAPETNKQDVEEVLAEFAKKDRSKCKKAEKNGMVCYLCIDENKVKHEECMYVADAKPKASHIAYHEVQKYKEPKPETVESAEATQILTSTQLPLLPLIPTVVPAESKRKHFFKKVEPLSIEPVAAASEEVGVITAVKKVSPKIKRRFSKKSGEPVASGSEEKEKTASSEEHAEPETPDEFKVGQYEGAFSAETKPVYSKIYGSHLPKYMVEKTDFEKEFDEFAHAF